MSAVPFARMRHLTYDKGCGTSIAVAHVCEVCLATAIDGDVSLVGFETYGSPLLSLHVLNRGRHSWISPQVLVHSFGQENVGVIDYARGHHHDVSVKR